MIPYTPEKIYDLKARYQAAIGPLFIQEEVIAGAQRPGVLRQHVFDTEQGLRLIISREQTKDGREVIHFSGSVFGGRARVKINEYMKRSRNHIPGGKELMDRFVRHAFGLISGGKSGVCIGWSDMGVPHYEIDVTPVQK